MGKKKGKRKSAAAQADTFVANQEIADELLVLQAIYDQEFALLEDGMGCRLHVVPSPGNVDSNEALAVDIELRCGLLLGPHLQSHANYVECALALVHALGPRRLTHSN
jgi:hypothetical protein